MLPGRFWILFCALIAFASFAVEHAWASSADCEGLPCIHILHDGFKCVAILNLGSERPMVSFTPGPVCTNDTDCVESRCLNNRCIENVTFDFYTAALDELRMAVAKSPENRACAAQLADVLRIFME